MTLPYECITYLVCSDLAIYPHKTFLWYRNIMNIFQIGNAGMEQKKIQLVKVSKCLRMPIGSFKGALTYNSLN